jgi:hypothetical protein
MGWMACAIRRAEAEISKSPRCSVQEKISTPIQSSNGYLLDELGHLSDSVFAAMGLARWREYRST